MFKRTQYSRAKAPLTPAKRRGSYAGSAGLAVPKEPVKAKPGKRAPTVEEAAWMSRIVQLGCIVCHLNREHATWVHYQAEVHHLLRGGHRIGHLFTIPLCPYHHRGESPNARHPWRKRFEAAYGTEESLLAMVREKLK